MKFRLNPNPIPNLWVISSSRNSSNSKKTRLETRLEDFVASVCLRVFFSVCSISYEENISKSNERILIKLLEVWGVAQGPTDKILVAIRIRTYFYFYLEPGKTK